MDAKPDPALVERFRADFARLTGRALGPDQRIGVAVSGGPDSMALLLLAQAAFGSHILAATVDHGLRAEASEEAAFVAGVCAALGVEHGTITLPDDAVPSGGNIQAKARRSRYTVLGEWMAERGCHLIATAHHVEDQAETLLMRLARGSGVHGLGSVRPVTTFPLPSLGHDLLIVRPVLGWRRKELRQLVDAAGIDPVIDPSNHDEAFDRARFRKLLEREQILGPERLARAASNLVDAEDALHWAARQAENERLTWRDATTLVLDTENLPRAIKRLLVSAALVSVHVKMGIYRRPVERLDDLIANVEAKGVATLAGVRCAANGEIWTFRPAPPRRTG